MTHNVVTYLKDLKSLGLQRHLKIEHLPKGWWSEWSLSESTTFLSHASGVTVEIIIADGQPHDFETDLNSSRPITDEVAAQLRDQALAIYIHINIKWEHLNLDIELTSTVESRIPLH